VHFSLAKEETSCVLTLVKTLPQRKEKQNGGALAYLPEPILTQSLALARQEGKDKQWGVLVCLVEFKVGDLLKVFQVAGE
jgi:hypothetical protein